MKHLFKFCCTIAIFGLIASCTNEPKNRLDLSKATILISAQIKSPVKESAATILKEEITKRTALNLQTASNWDAKTFIAVALSGDKNLLGEVVPKREGANLPEFKKEGYRLFHEVRNGKNILWIIGADARGILYGIGKLLMIAETKEKQLSLAQATDIASSPEYAIRGHQFGYRMTANSWDAWTIQQFDQHFREQILFGANSIEGIPFQDERLDTLMKYPRAVMNIELSKICARYDADYWVWAALEVDLKNSAQRQAALDKYEALFKDCPRFDGVFFPGGDPGDNHPAEVMPFLEELTVLLHKYHPGAGMWISLQGFNKEKTDYFFKYLAEKNPDWLTGVANGPSSPPLAEERQRLPKKYKLRSYPDLTHTVRCQYPVKNWDQAFALTEGRECTNPQPLYYAGVHNRDAVYTDGFISYSDGVHDDVNKIVWSQMAWDTKQNVRNVVVEYCSFFFGSKLAGEAADGILGLEQNWVGELKGNATIGKTLVQWKKLEAENPQLALNWRWQQLVMRAYYDAYIQQRQAYEQKLELEANAILKNAKELGADKAMDQALAQVQKADKEFVAQDLKQKAIKYIDDLFKSVGLQTSVKLYNAAGSERGCVRDFIDYPLNNRWWLEDEFKKIKDLKSEDEKLTRLEFIRTYDNPGEGSYYDNISNTNAKHVTSETEDAIDFLWEKEGLSRKRLSSQLFQFTPELQYNDLNPGSNYLIRVTGLGEALLRANDKRLIPTKYEKEFGGFKEFPLSKELIKDGKLKITFDKPDEENVGWRNQSRICEVWVLKR
ncbi:MAG: hypothetical protein WCL21_01630 [Mariniphaga sp.]